MTTTTKLLIACVVIAGCQRDPFKDESLEEQHKREKAEMQQRLEQQQQAKSAEAKAAAERQRQADEEQQRQREAQDRQRQEAERERVAAFAALSPAEREKQLRVACESGCDAATARALIRSAKTDAERSKLQSLADRLDAAASAKIGEERRTAFASTYDQLLLAKKLNPDGVSATGPAKTTLSVRGWFCTRQFVHDFGMGPDGRQARSLGFKKLECESAVQSWEQEL